ncbi:MAG TPA: hypothetical protein VLH38_02590, partial [Patescibacteria group bacterium]|nr:hypothetical protein [Patescibacteria group bacterium]
VALYITRELDGTQMDLTDRMIIIRRLIQAATGSPNHDDLLEIVAMCSEDSLLALLVNEMCGSDVSVIMFADHEGNDYEEANRALYAKIRMQVYGAPPAYVYVRSAGKWEQLG